MVTLVTAESLADRLAVKPRTIRDWARTGKIPSVRITSKVIRFDVDEVYRALQENEKRKRKGKEND